MYFQITTTGAVEQSIQKFNQFLQTYQDGHPETAFGLHDFHWEDAWPGLVRMAIARAGADVSEVGAPWVSDFVAMDSLRPFSRAEVEAVGGARAYFPATWANVVISPSSLTPGTSAWATSAPGVYALPGRADVRLLYYWKDMLEKAGVDPDTAFSTPAMVEDTLEKLHACGSEAWCRTPWISKTHVTRDWVYTIASWIWAHGGRLVDEIGLPVFDQPEAIEGIAAYFRLHRYLAPMESNETAEQVFSQRRAAVTVLGTHYHVHLIHDEDPWAAPTGAKKLLDRLGAAALPGPSFVGGTSFVIWRHTSNQAVRVAVDLLTRFSNSPHLAGYCYETHMLPSRIDGLYHPDIAADPFLPVMRAALEGGRAHPAGRLWMPIADAFSSTCVTILKELRAAPGLDERAVVERHMRELVKRLRRSFAAE